ncbi:MAG: bifunctional phosphopantothenoylcysteine decarboxylase/phosphopantothenate--cysteine ligase CoaBC [Spirochaetales bacterium]|nr:bifunctional phosphopantothenoylcysteine decarboxylase/phosphopantothenate--cysteine ligase CoaBC [Spirochaetales bacterium]
MSLLDKNILIHVSGSISAYKACSLVSSLKKRGAQVRVSLSDGGKRFVGKTTFEGLTGEGVYDSLWEGKPDFVPHITLAQNWADLLLVYPASANTINRLAGGMADDLFGGLFLANNFHKPVWIAPAMNSEMFSHRAVQESLEKLTRWGCRILPTGEGLMACGTRGKGRLWEPEDTLKEIEGLFRREADRDLAGKTLIITSGGCEEAVDGVRCLSNFSSGQTGTVLAEEALSRGASVKLLASKRARIPKAQDNLSIVRFTDYEDLQKKLFIAMENKPDGLIMAAAVSDFSVDKISINGEDSTEKKGKLSSTEAPILYLKKNGKLLDKLSPHYSGIRTVAFKLTKSKTESVRQEGVTRLFNHEIVDYVLANDLNEIEGEKHLFKLISRDGTTKTGRTKADLSKAVLDVWSGNN